jgi:hypothetical protein
MFVVILVHFPNFSHQEKSGNPDLKRRFCFAR